MTKSLGKRKLIRDISANTLQTGVTQVFGLVLFYLTSRFLTKEEFGELSWTTALGATAIAILSLGLDLVLVKKVAQGEDVLTVSGIHYFHTVLSGVILTLLTLALFLTNEFVQQVHPLLFLVFFNLAITNIANSFKLCLNGLEAYKKLAELAVIINVVKVVLVATLLLIGIFGLRHLILAYVLSSLVEYTLAYYLTTRYLKHSIKPVLKPIQYKYFILESLPQLGVVIFDSALARIDWILLGIIGTAAATAEYSFAYKVFELSKLPLLISAPILLTRLSRNLKAGKLNERMQNEFEFFFRLEMFIVMILPVALSSCWSDLIDFFTNGKYGTVNDQNYLILAICVPLSAFINLYWTIGFVLGKLKSIMIITIVTSLFNILCNSILIQLYGTKGAAISFLASTILQLLLYRIMVPQNIIKIKFASVFLVFTYAIVAVVLARFLGLNVIFSGLIAVLLFSGFSVATKTIKFSEFKMLKRTDKQQGPEKSNKE